MKKPVRTIRPLLHGAFRLNPEERELWIAGATELGESLNQFVRLAIRERAHRVIKARDRRQRVAAGHQQEARSAVSA